MSAHQFASYWRSQSFMRAIAGFLIATPLLLGSPRAYAATGEDYAAQVGEQLVGRTVSLPQVVTIDGKTIDLSALRGRKAVYLKFWATWCGPCRKQVPHFENVQRSAGEDLEVIGVNIGFDDTLEQIKAYRRELGLSMPLVRDDDGGLSALFGLRVTPQHVVIGKDGRVFHVGHLADGRLDEALKQARESAPARTSLPRSRAPAAGVGHGAAISSLKLKTVDGNDIMLADPLAKRRTVLIFLSPWCEDYFRETRPESSAQCRAVREHLATVKGESTVRWIGVASALWASEEDVREYSNKHRIVAPITLDQDGALFRRFGVDRVPAAILLDEHGNLVRARGSGRVHPYGASASAREGD